MLKEKPKKAPHKAEMEISKKTKSRMNIVGPATRPSPEVLFGLTDACLDSGIVETKEEPPAEFLKREINEVESPKKIPWEDIPDWLKQQLDCGQGGSREAAFKLVIKHLREKPNEKNMRLAQMVVNEIGRSSDGGEFLMKHIPQDLVDKFLNKEE